MKNQMGMGDSIVIENRKSKEYACQMRICNRICLLVLDDFYLGQLAKKIIPINGRGSCKICKCD
jgi:hypothetical protein